jgi:hypothetical protein
MEVEAPVRRDVEDGLREYEAVGDHHAGIDIESPELLRGLGRFQRMRREDGYPEPICGQMNGRLPLRHTASGRAGWLCVHGHDLMSLSDDLGKGRDGELRRAEESQAHDAAA